MNSITICGYPEHELSVETIDNLDMRSWWYYVRGRGNRLYSTIEENLKKIIYWALLGDDARVNQYKSILASPGGSSVQLPEVPGFPSRNYINDLYIPNGNGSTHSGAKTTPDGALQFSARGTPLEHEINRLCATRDMKIKLEVNTRDIITTSYIAGQNGTFKLGGLRYLTTFILNNYGYIAGLGGNAGAAHASIDRELTEFWYDIDCNLQSDYTRGKKGTDAIQLDLPFTAVTINNHGFIFGGGGGGAGCRVKDGFVSKPNSYTTKAALYNGYLSTHIATGGLPFGSGSYRVTNGFRVPAWGTNSFRNYASYYTVSGADEGTVHKNLNAVLLPRRDRYYVRTPFPSMYAQWYCFQTAYRESWLAGSNSFPTLPPPQYQWKSDFDSLRNIAAGGWLGEDGYVSLRAYDYGMGKLIVDENKQQSVIGDHTDTFRITRISYYPCDFTHANIECTHDVWQELRYSSSYRGSAPFTSWEGSTTSRDRSYVGLAGAALRITASNLNVYTPGENSYGRLGDYINF